ncbi:polyprotein [Plakobranchus ocellatus]|uniref:Polyprotein n=1 Tax=Plakobranchus ocellatus TaxID=259542 RepID=A0AAV4DI71_9GAST|nr:polyprotein [Plakobranchus ocellatus]
MDDTTIICSKEDETRRMLTRLDDLTSWCRMEFKPKKSRSLSIRRGKVDEATTFTVAEQQISTVIKNQSRASEDDRAMYSRKAKLKLQMKYILEEYKCGKARLLTMLEESDDPVVKTDRKGLGSTTAKWWSQTEGKEKGT